MVDLVIGKTNQNASNNYGGDAYGGEEYGEYGDEYGDETGPGFKREADEKPIDFM